MKINKKAAMFGLDARIALAIFGALSVISGAALYSAIEKAKTTAHLSDIQEIIKAFEAYYLDVGERFEITDGTNYAANELVSSTKSKWKGPYLQYAISDRQASYAHYKDRFLDYSKIPGTNIFFSQLRSTNFQTTSGSGAGNGCSVATDCAIYLAMSNFSSNSPSLDKLGQKIDQMVDGGDGKATGLVRGLNHSSGAYYFYYKIIDKRNW